MPIRAADERARLVAGQLIKTLNEFNDHHPDPDADQVAERLEYLTDDYIIQMCASTLAEAYIVIPEEDSSGRRYRKKDRVPEYETSTRK